MLNAEWKLYYFYYLFGLDINVTRNITLVRSMTQVLHVTCDMYELRETVPWPRGLQGLAATRKDPGRLRSTRGSRE